MRRQGACYGMAAAAAAGPPKPAQPMPIIPRPTFVAYQPRLVYTLYNKIGTCMDAIQLNCDVILVT